MLKQMIYKELKLITHPTNIMFLLLSALVLVPNYSYYVTFFYTTLGIFFASISGRENNDIHFSMALPIRKRDIVKARFIFVIIFELAQVVITIPFAMIRQTYSLPTNQVGMEANIAFLGLSLVMLGIFNYIFLTNYYHNPDNIGKPFALANVAIWFFMVIAETSVHVVPFLKNDVDTMDTQYLGIKFIFLSVGAILFVILTYSAYKKSINTFEAIDL